MKKESKTRAKSKTLDVFLGKCLTLRRLMGITEAFIVCKSFFRQIARPPTLGLFLEMKITKINNLIYIFCILKEPHSNAETKCI